jgi:hypothetical protein
MLNVEVNFTSMFNIFHSGFNIFKPALDIK